jgi:hypothetical protein
LFCPTTNANLPLRHENILNYFFFSENLIAFDTDMTDATGLRTVHISAKQLSDGIDDTVMVAGSEAYQAALVFYNAVKAAAAQDIPGAKGVYDDLKARFPRVKRKNEE